MMSLVNTNVTPDFKTLAILDSPLQVMMAMEYIKEFKIQNVDFVISVHSVDYLKLNRSVLRYLNDVGVKYKIFVTLSLIKTFRFINSPKIYDKIIIGDFRSLDKKLLTLFHAKRRFDIVYVDDGNASFELESGFTNTHGIRSHISMIVDKLIDRRAMDKAYYSAFIDKKEIKGIRIIPNNLKGLKIVDKERSNDIIVIGCFTSFFESIGLNYHEMLQKLNSYIKERWGETKILYYPHRRENDIKGIDNLCNNMGWSVCFSRINIELELAHSETQPHAIIGFGSSALFLLKRIFRDVVVETIHFTESEDYLNIEKVYKESDISVVNL